MEWLIKIGLAIAGIIHFLPLSGLAGASQLEKLYGISVADPGLLILMKHRAVMFGILGTLMIVAIFAASLRTTAICAGLVSTVAFIVIAALQGNYPPAIRTVVIADWVAIAGLAAAAIVHFAGKSA